MAGMLGASLLVEPQSFLACKETEARGQEGKPKTQDCAGVQYFQNSPFLAALADGGCHRGSITSLTLTTPHSGHLSFQKQELS